MFTWDAAVTDLLEILKRYDALPPSAVVSSKAAAALLGMSERSVRYHPNLPRVQVARGRYGFRKSDIEKLSRDGWQPLGEVAQRVVESGSRDIRRRRSPSEGRLCVKTGEMPTGGAIVPASGEHRVVASENGGARKQ
jgi:hypothetical protein